MRRPVLFLALIASAPLAATAIGGTGMPDDRVVVRDCYGQAELNDSLQQQFGYGRSGGAPGGVAVGSAPPPPPRSPAPMAPVEEAEVALSKGRGGLHMPSLGGGGKKAKSPAKSSASNMVEPALEASAEEVPLGRDYASEVTVDEDMAGGDAVADGWTEGIASEDDARERRAKDTDGRYDTDKTVRSTPQRVLDWGASIFLSNDDSMSLASAQRVIYALQNGRGLPMEHIRPHELLNYFSFDVAEPSDEQLFDVHASATQNGDQLSVALAVQGATPERQPLDLTMVVDRSCSMEDEGRMEYTKRGLRQMTEQLKRGDRVDLVLFDDGICTPLENFVVGRDDPSLLADAIEGMRPEGGTNLDIGLREGYRVSSGHVDTHRRNRRMMLITDAEMNMGDIDPNTVTEIGRAYEDEGIRLTGIGVGTTFRDDVLDKLTEKGKGAYVFLGSEAVVDRVFGSGFASLTETIAHDVQFELDLPDSLAMERFYGEEASTVAADIQPINYYAGTSQVFLQDLTLRGGKAAADDPITLTIRYRDAQSGEPAKRVFKTTVGKMMGSDPHNVHKAQTLMAWTDMLQARAMGGDACGAPLETYASRASRLSDDAEIAFVNNLVIGMCGELPLPTTVAAAPLKVRVDSDQPISRVALSCPGVDATETLSGSDTIARFDAAVGQCTVTLGGVVDLRVDVEVPETGRDLRCTVRGGRVHCS